MLENPQLGDVYKTIPECAGVNYNMNDSKEFYILAHFINSTNTHNINCYPYMLNTEYIYTGVQAKYTDALRLSSTERKGNWVVPIILLRDTGKRVIDMNLWKDLPSPIKPIPGNILKEQYIHNAVKSSMMFQHQNSIEEIRKNYPKTFLQGLPTKQIFSELIRHFNDKSKLTCPWCLSAISYTKFKDIAYIRSSKAFVRCTSCGEKSYVQPRKPSVLDKSPTPFRLKKTNS